MIITLYKPQAALLEETLRKFLPKKLESGSIKVATVDASQGSEAPHIILSTVRSNGNQSIGFASNPRRLCVAISRAQKTLTVFGNASVFQQSRPHWQQVVEHFRREGTLQATSEGALSGSLKEFVEGRAVKMVEARPARSDQSKGGKDSKGGKGGKGGKGCTSSKGIGKGKGMGKGKGFDRCLYWSPGNLRSGIKGARRIY
ncbi:Helicase required for RNAi-mediated heterochromatin assembly 1 [Durusdinium trenchii]|uniref:Helicase required for RNAi-mediated heterochromatin assembly 1 n=1 Tax=Durusdinium trenchii TaxID=1381693 RepID=A0ABP0QGP7_9DINO